MKNIIYPFKDKILARMIDEAHYIVENKATVRLTCKHFGVSKSTVHLDCTDRLKELAKHNKSYRKLYKEVKKVIETNKEERNYRGGLATKAASLKRKQEKRQKSEGGNNECNISSL